MRSGDVWTMGEGIEGNLVRVKTYYTFPGLKILLGKHSGRACMGLLDYHNHFVFEPVVFSRNQFFAF